MSTKQDLRLPQSDRWSYLWLVIGTVLMVFIGGSWPLALAGWLASVFMLRFFRTQKLWRGFILVILGLSIANAIAWRVQNPTPFPALIFGIMTGTYISLPFLVDRLLAPRFQARGKSSFWSTLVFPLLLTASQFLFFNNLLFGSYGAWGYAFHANLSVIQLASLTGIWGLVFMIGWFASVVNWAWEREFSWPDIQHGVWIHAGVLLLVFAYGGLRLMFYPQPAQTVRVHSFTVEEKFGRALMNDELVPLAQTDLETFRDRTADINDAYIEGSIQQAQAGAQIVVWPEGAGVGNREDVEALIDRGQAVADDYDIYLVMGVFIFNLGEDVAPNDIIEMRLVIADPSGQVVLDHLKYAYGLGDPLSQVELQTVDTPYGRMSGILCGDMDIPNIVKQAGRKGVDILFNPSHENIPDDLYWHVRFAPFRAVENGVSVVRPTAGGISMASDPYGRVLAWMDHTTTEEWVMVAHVPTRRVPTLYAAVGDAFGWLTVVGSLLIAGWAIFKGKRTHQLETSSSIPSDESGS